MSSCEVHKISNPPSEHERASASLWVARLVAPWANKTKPVFTDIAAIQRDFLCRKSNVTRPWNDTSDYPTYAREVVKYSTYSNLKQLTIPTKIPRNDSSFQEVQRGPDIRASQGQRKARVDMSLVVTSASTWVRGRAWGSWGKSGWIYIESHVMSR